MYITNITSRFDVYKNGLIKICSSLHNNVAFILELFIYAQIHDYYNLEAAESITTPKIDTCNSSMSRCKDPANQALLDEIIREIEGDPHMHGKWTKGEITCKYYNLILLHIVLSLMCTHLSHNLQRFFGSFSVQFVCFDTI